MERIPTSSLYTGEREANDSILAKAERIKTKLSSFLEAPQIPEEVKASIAERLQKLERFASTSQFRSLTLAAIASVSIYSYFKPISKELEAPAPRYEITAEKKPSGEIEYHHEDRETEEILDWVTGYGPEPAEFEKEKLMAIRRAIQFEIKWTGIDPTSYPNLDQLDGQGLESVAHAVAIDMLEKGITRGSYTAGEKNPAAREVAIKAEVDHLINISPVFDKSPELYSKLWQLQQKVGAPRIRFLTERKNPSEDTRYIISQGRAHYNGASNTMYITLNEADVVFRSEDSQAILGDIVAESAHADQFVNDSRETQRKKQLESLGRIHHIFLSVKSRSELYDRSYNKPGTIEHDAHSIREPELWKSLGKVPRRGEKPNG